MKSQQRQKNRDKSSLPTQIVPMMSVRKLAVYPPMTDPVPEKMRLIPTVVFLIEREKEEGTK